MNKRTKTGLEILQVAVVVGVLGDVLLRQTPWGLNALLFNLAFVAGMAVLLIRHAPQYLTKQTIALFTAQIFFASMFIWRDSSELRVANVFAIVGILGIIFLPTLKITARIAGVFQYAVSFVWAALNSAFAAGALFGMDIHWSSVSTSGWRRTAFSVVRGVLIALPLLLIFGALFVAADAVYEGWVRRVFNIDFEIAFSHMMLFAVFSWLSAGYLRGLLFAGAGNVAQAVSAIVAESTESDDSPMTKVRAESGEHPVTLPGDRSVIEHLNTADAPSDEEKQADSGAEEPVNGNASATSGTKWSWARIDNSIIPGFTLGTVEIGVILGLINLLFLSFVIVQVPYLFGGMELVQNTPDFKLADYARRGFGELVAVSALVLPILLVSHWLVRKETPRAENLFRVLAGIQIALLFVIMASAVQRLVLLTGNLGYGLTTVRLYPLIFMTWLALVFVWFGATVLRGARQYFAWGALWSAFFILGVTHVLNPDELIVRHNLALMREGREFDATYNSQLSDDALPTLYNSFHELNADDQQLAIRQLARRYCEKRDESGVRSWNVSRSLATQRLESNRAFVAEVGACDSPLVGPVHHND